MGRAETPVLLLEARFRTKDAFLRDFVAEPPPGLIFCRTREELEEGSEVRVRLFFKPMPNKLIMRGTVFRRQKLNSRGGQRGGVWVHLNLEDQEIIESLVELEEGSVPGWSKRQHLRYPVQIAVAWGRDRTLDSYEGIVNNISMGGAFLIANERVAARGETVRLRFFPARMGRPVEVAGEVVHQRREGYGISFHYQRGGGQRRLEELVRRLLAAEYAM